MRKQREDTLKCPRRQWKPDEIAVIVTALSALMTSLATLLNALK